jgi:predicted RNA binding protein YcfA (HicA-like mRNA interferase family)
LTRLPELSWKDTVKALERAGFVFDRQKGSHLVYYHPDTQATVTIPKHSSIKKGTLMQIIKQTGLTRDEFLELTGKR